MDITITDIQQGCTHDGPGLRTAVFFKGCPLHCRWCHNPETKRPEQSLFFRPELCIGCMACLQSCPQGAHREENGKHVLLRSLCTGCMDCAKGCPAGALEAAGKTVSLDYVLDRVLEDRVFYRGKGGLTVTGGEPTFQPEVLLALLAQTKSAGIHTCVETCGVFPPSLVPKLAGVTDLFLYDIKDTDPQRLLENTGAHYQTVVQNLLALDALGAQTVLRCLLIPEINMDEAHAQRLIALYRQLQNCLAVELLAYHPYGLSKSRQLGQQDPEFTQPSPAKMQSFAQILLQADIPVKLYGSIL